jgi:hypothetical protein
MPTNQLIKPRYLFINYDVLIINFCYKNTQDNVGAFISSMSLQMMSFRCQYSRDIKAKRKYFFSGLKSFELYEDKRICVTCHTSVASE